MDLRPSFTSKVTPDKAYRRRALTPKSYLGYTTRFYQDSRCCILSVPYIFHPALIVAALHSLLRSTLAFSSLFALFVSSQSSFRTVLLYTRGHSHRPVFLYRPKMIGSRRKVESHRETRLPRPVPTAERALLSLLVVNFCSGSGWRQRRSGLGMSVEP